MSCLGLTRVFCYVLEHLPAGIPANCRAGIGGGTGGLGFFTTAVSRKTVSVWRLYRIDAAAFQVTMVPHYLVLNRLGFLDTPLAIICPGIFSTFPVFIMTKGFDAVSRSMLEAAALDGAGYGRTFWSIGLPLGMPGILAALVLGFLEAWNAVEQPMTFLKDPSNWPLSLYLPQTVQEQLSLAMVSGLVALTPAVLMFLFGQKYLELGIQASGLKE